MDIAALSTAMSQASLQQQVSLSVTNKAMDQAEVASEGLIKMMEQSVSPHLGSSIDVKA
ncbi:YjfB family protein [Paraliobacillus salinarum]|uniref:YjfB family protein n=1 Tax=Paraliobacillus salinarum TaxID=1158996 RepID=UPI0015F53E08|nr:YjfB family protein [Paraliobacillus salinarum]